MRKDLPGVDIVKFVMAFAVVIIHVFAICSSVPGLPVVWIMRLAVPFFFITSGYLLRRSLVSQDELSKDAILKNRVNKTLRIYIKWVLIYVPLAVVYYVTQHIGPRDIVVDFLKHIVVTGEYAYAWPLWYLYSLIIVLTVIRMLAKIKFPMWALFGIFIILAAWNHYAEANASGATWWISKFVSRGLGGGIYILAGFYIHDFLKNLAQQWALGLALVMVSVVMFLYNVALWELFGGVGVFCLALSVPIHSSSLTLYLRRQSMWIYFIHMYPVVVFYQFAHYEQWPLFVASAATSYVAAVIIIWLSDTKRLPWLKGLIS